MNAYIKLNLSLANKAYWPPRDARDIFAIFYPGTCSGRCSWIYTTVGLLLLITTVVTYRSFTNACVYYVEITTYRTFATAERRL